MINVYLFDWGDTLMVDFPDASGKMCDWVTVAAVSGAKETLAALSKKAQIYIATSAADSTELDILRAFERVDLQKFISGYFCQANVGYAKGTPEFLSAILAKLNISADNVVMVGDNFEKDIKPAIAAGVKAVWFNNNNTELMPNSVSVIKQLSELIDNRI